MKVVALCPFCKLRGSDFKYCTRCKQQLPENVQKILINTYDMYVSDSTNSISSTETSAMPKRIKIQEQPLDSNELNRMYVPLAP